MALPPLPNVNSRPPGANRSAIAARRGRATVGPTRSSVASLQRALGRDLASDRCREIDEQGVGVALVAFDERDRGSRCPRSRQLARSVDRVDACDGRAGVESTRSPGPTGATRCVSTSLDAAAVRTAACAVPPTVTTSASVPSSEHVMHVLVVARVVDGREQARVLEAHVGELPEHVVAQHRGGRRTRAEPDRRRRPRRTWSAAPGRRAWPAADPHAWSAPRPRPLAAPSRDRGRLAGRHHDRMSPRSRLHAQARRPDRRRRPRPPAARACP